MAKTLRTSGDYTIKAGDGNNSGSGTNSITLDSLNVTVNGNLTVGGTSSTISTTNTVIEDNIIELRPGSGITPTIKNKLGCIEHSYSHFSISLHCFHCIEKDKKINFGNMSETTLLTLGSFE